MHVVQHLAVLLYTEKRHSIISGLESWIGVLEWSLGVEWSGVKFGGDFGVEFGVCVFLVES